MPAYEGQTQRLVPPCPLCGGTTFTWGRLTAQGGTYFRADGESFLDAFFQIPGTIDARACTSCGNIQLFLAGTANTMKRTSAQRPKGKAQLQEDDDDDFWTP